jgi:hypothetical protein
MLRDQPLAAIRADLASGARQAMDIQVAGIAAVIAETIS